MKRLLGADVNLSAEQFLEILNQAGMVQETASGLPRDEKVQVATLVRFAANDGAEYSQIPSTSLFCETQNLFAIVLA